MEQAKVKSLKKSTRNIMDNDKGHFLKKISSVPRNATHGPSNTSHNCNRCSERIRKK